MREGSTLLGRSAPHCTEPFKNHVTTDGRESNDCREGDSSMIVGMRLFSVRVKDLQRGFSRCRWLHSRVLEITAFLSLFEHKYVPSR